MKDRRLILNNRQPGLNRFREKGGSAADSFGVRDAYTNRPYTRTFFNWFLLEKNSAALVAGNSNKRVYLVPEDSKPGNVEFSELERQRRSIMEA